MATERPAQRPSEVGDGPPQQATRHCEGGGSEPAEYPLTADLQPMQIDRTRGEAELVAIGAGQEIIATGAFGEIQFEREVMADETGFALRIGKLVIEPALIGIDVTPITKIVEIPDHPFAGGCSQQIDAALGKAAADQSAMKAFEARIGEGSRLAAADPGGLMQPTQLAQKILRFVEAAGAAEDERSERPIAALGPADLITRVAARPVERIAPRSAQ